MAADRFLDSVPVHVSASLLRRTQSTVDLPPLLRLLHHPCAWCWLPQYHFPSLALTLTSNPAGGPCTPMREYN